MKSVYTGSEKVAEFESYDELRIGDSKPAFIYEGNELVYPNPVKDGLVLWYDFSGRTNADSQRGVAEDLSGNGNHGTLQNFNYTAESGYDGNKLKFDGIDDRLTIPHLALDKTAMSVTHNGNIYVYEDDEVVTVNKYSDGARAELDGLEVGGRNLILDSSNIQRRSLQAGVTSEKVTDMGYPNVLKINNPDLRSYFTINRDSYAEYPIANKDFTLSFLVRGIADENSNKTLTIYYNSSTMYLPMKGDVKEDEYSWVSITLNTDDNVPNNHIGVSSFKELYFAKMKVEMGNEATVWTPAPEDFQTTSLSPSSLSNLQLYNRPLTPAEVAQNYAIEKERFGIE